MLSATVLATTVTVMSTAVTVLATTVTVVTVTASAMAMATPAAAATVATVESATSTPVEIPNLPRALGPADFREFNPAQADLGRLLFYDKILSGNRNISCGTCHHHDLGSSDGLSLGIGEGGAGLGPKRNAGAGDSRIKKRVPRNAPALWNVGAKSITKLFHDGRVEVSDIYDNGFNTPAQEWLPAGIGDILAAQALFPLAAEFEMAGNPKENEIAGAAYNRIDTVWPLIAARVRAIPEYAEMFTAAFADVQSADDISIVHIARALAAFQGTEWRSFDSAFDAFLRGDSSALKPAAKRGAKLFYGKAKCARCHAEPLLTDHKFHALALPHFGPGRTRPWDPIVRDVGRMGVSDRIKDAYRFRTPQLRNVALTAPYGHNGAYPTLRGIIRHHSAPRRAFDAWSPALARLPAAPHLASGDFIALQDSRERARLRARSDIATVALSAADIDDLVAFMHSLTGRDSRFGLRGRPARVPSGLAVD